MNSGIYTAFSGLRAQMDALDMMANNLANVNTTGFKEDNAFFTLLEKSINQSPEPDQLNSTINQSIVARAAINPTAGSIRPTNRDLDIAIEGDGFLVVQMPGGTGYTRNGSLRLNDKSVLTTSEGFPVVSITGQPITLGSGKIHINKDGEVSLDGTSVGRLKVVSFDDISMLQKEGSSLFTQKPGLNSEKPSNAKISSGYLEQSNVNAVSSVVRMVEIMRHFEALQKSVSLMMNEINEKSIEKLGN
jgi:flagellar basal-body rod protein FlgF